MAAIWGAVTGNLSISEISEKMNKAMSAFKLDRVDSITRGKAFFACGHQFFTPESLNDVSPYLDDEKSVLFAGDCFLINREELMESLCMENDSFDKSELSDKGDVQLAYLAYLTFGEAFVNELLGSFAFAVYEEKKERLILYTDHTAQRYLIYCAKAEGVFFAQVFQPILSAVGAANLAIDEEWLVSAFTDCSADTVKIPGRTVYRDVVPIEPGTYTIIDLSSNEKRKNTYWNPVESVEKTWITSDEKMRKQFVETLRETADNMLRTDGNVGIQLSGGLDSSTVAGLIAGKLAKMGKQLFSYTSVPTSGYQYVNNNRTVENEAKYISDQKEMYNNLCPRFVDYGDKNAFTNIDRYINGYAQPVKPIVNMPLLEAMAVSAANDGCKLLFSGGNGNATISYGRIFTYEYQKLKAFQLKKAVKQMNTFCGKFRVSRKRFIKLFLKTFWEEKIKTADSDDSDFTRNDLKKKYKVKSLLKKIRKTRGTGSLDSVKQRKHFCFMPEVFQHMGAFDTYSSLKYGILNLDPTLTKPVIELCMSMPIDFFVKDGKERRAVRDYMRGIVADSILDNYSARGDQAADFAYCVNRDWEKIGSDVICRLNNPLLREYLDDSKLKLLTDEIQNNAGKLGRTEVAKGAVLCSLGSFLNYFDSMKKNA